MEAPVDAALSTSQLLEALIPSFRSSSTAANGDDEIDLDEAAAAAGPAKLLQLASLPPAGAPTSAVFEQVLGALDGASMMELMIRSSSSQRYVNAKILAWQLSTVREETLAPLCQSIRASTQSCMLELLGLPQMQKLEVHEASTDGLVSAVRAALHRKFPGFDTDGFSALYLRKPVVYLSSACSPRAQSALMFQLGLPQSNIVIVPVVEGTELMDMQKLGECLEDDKNKGRTPVLLVAQAGTPLTGDVDNLEQLQELCQKERLWFHLQGSSLSFLGVPGAASEKICALVAASDSATIELHVWCLLAGGVSCTVIAKADPGAGASAEANVRQGLNSLSLWTTLQTMGREELVAAAQQAFTLADYMQECLDQMPQLTRLVLNEGAVRAPVLLYSGIQWGLVLSEVEHLEGVSVVVHEGKEWLRFTPLQAFSWTGAEKQNIDRFASDLHNKLLEMDAMLACRAPFQEAAAAAPNLTHVSVADTGSSLGAFRYVPSYIVGHIDPDAKAEIGALNQQLAAQLLGMQESGRLLGVTFDFRTETCAEGMACIRVALRRGVLTGALCHELMRAAARIAVQLKDNEALVARIGDAVQAGIQAAQDQLDKANEERLLNEGLMRQVPVVSTMLNWLSPTPAMPDVEGRSFKISSGKLERRSTASRPRASNMMESERMVTITRQDGEAIGLELNATRSGVVQVVKVAAGSAAAQSGEVTAGDRIIAIDGYSMEETAIDVVIATLQNAGSEFNLTVVSPASSESMHAVDEDDADAGAGAGDS